MRLLGCLAVTATVLALAAPAAAASMHAPAAVAPATSATLSTFGFSELGGGDPGTRGQAFQQVALGPGRSAALTPDGRVVLFGENTSDIPNVPASLTGKTVTQLADGGDFVLALRSDGSITAWGSPDIFGAEQPPAALAGKTVTAIAAGSDGGQALALTSTGRVYAWGNNINGKAVVPAAVRAATVVGLAAGTRDSGVITSAGKVIVWGDNSAGQRKVPAALAHKTVTSLAIGGTHVVALTSDGAVTAWGSDTDGESDVPASLAGKSVVDISAGSNISFAVTADGRVIGWGYDGEHETDVPAAIAARQVVAVDTSVSETAVLVAAPRRLAITPRAASTTVGVRVRYSTVGFEGGGARIGDVTDTTTFTIRPAVGGGGEAKGATCSGRACTAKTPGLYQVTADDAGTLMHTTLTVTA